ncbi:MAG: hypothetical protein CV087_05700 [Candidatus Brocadia sp. WS118]|nr:MAG: hypothetical protein CV087_05700 [Candidatus Brocadia sp. WS118]
MKMEVVQEYKNRKVFLLLVSLIFLSGCATTGGAKGMSKQGKAMSQITKGTTTKDEVRGILGNPSGTYKNSDSTEMWTYSSSDFNKKMAKRSGAMTAIAGASTVSGYLIPFAGPIIGTIAMGKMVNTPMTVSAESVTVSFDSKGVVSSISTSTQEIGGD